ncbi:hypothetical protein L345_18469 [Ophiophagus hannah]|uniref:Uncharacterized protein n=1 Tax=Ophiophagus hannah TaxID=8665 RepID=V8N2N6_OPHHA|nr:hypothetical protein L345_18469 [Ophiophagus hannah]
MMNGWMGERKKR